MVLHELATNATKYGALSCPDGHIALSWQMLSDPEGDGLELVWRETGTPATTAVLPTGFGSELCRRLVAGLGGIFTSEMTPAGLMATIHLPAQTLMAGVPPPSG